MGAYGPYNQITFSATNASSGILSVDSRGFHFNSQIFTSAIGRSDAYNCSLPSKSGTIALTSDISITNIKLLDSINLWSSGYQASLYKYAHFFLYGTSGGTMEYSIGNVSSTLSNGYTVEIIRFGNIFYKKVYYSNNLVSYNYHNLNTTGTTNLITQKINIYGGSGFVKGITFNF